MKHHKRRKTFISALNERLFAFLCVIGSAKRHYPLFILGTTLLSGCGGRADSSAAPVAERGQFTGQVTRGDGTPIALPGVKYNIKINGVTAVGERNTFSPPVGTDGKFALKLPQGLFYPPTGTVTFPFEGKNYVAGLDPINPFEGTRDGETGISQNFAWRLTGPKPTVPNADINNATHWFGISVPLIFSVYRNDTNEVQKPLPEGTKLTWQLTPLSKLIDGSEAKPLTVERNWTFNAFPPVHPLNDLPPANYEVTAVATLPDGSTKTLLLVDASTLNGYQKTFKMVLHPYANSGEIVVPTISWVAE